MQPYYTQKKMEEDKSEYLGFFTRWLKPIHESKKKALVQEEEEELKRLLVRSSVSQSMSIFKSTPPTPNGYVYGADAISEEVIPEPIDMTQYIHKDEMVQILLDSRHAMFNNRIPSVLEVLEWIDQRERKNK